MFRPILKGSSQCVAVCMFCKIVLYVQLIGILLILITTINLKKSF